MSKLRFVPKELEGKIKQNFGFKGDPALLGAVIESTEFLPRDREPKTVCKIVTDKGEFPVPFNRLSIDMQKEEFEAGTTVISGIDPFAIAPVVVKVPAPKRPTNIPAAAWKVMTPEEQAAAVA